MHKWNIFDRKFTRFNLYFGSNTFRQHKLAKVKIKSCRFSIKSVSFVHAWISLSYLTGIVFACFLTFYCDPYSLLKFLFIFSFFTFYCTIAPHLSALKLETKHLCNLVMHVPSLLFQLRHFVFVLQCNF